MFNERARAALSPRNAPSGHSDEQKGHLASTVSAGTSSARAAPTTSAAAPATDAADANDSSDDGSSSSDGSSTTTLAKQTQMGGEERLLSLSSSWCPWLMLPHPAWVAESEARWGGRIVAMPTHELCATLRVHERFSEISAEAAVRLLARAAGFEHGLDFELGGSSDKAPHGSWVVLRGLEQLVALADLSDEAVKAVAAGEGEKRPTGDGLKRDVDPITLLTVAAHTPLQAAAPDASVTALRENLLEATEAMPSPSPIGEEEKPSATQASLPPVPEEGSEEEEEESEDESADSNVAVDRVALVEVVVDASPSRTEMALDASSIAAIREHGALTPRLFPTTYGVELTPTSTRQRAHIDPAPSVVHGSNANEQGSSIAATPLAVVVSTLMLVVSNVVNEEATRVARQVKLSCGKAAIAAAPVGVLVSPMMLVVSDVVNEEATEVAREILTKLQQLPPAAEEQQPASVACAPPMSSLIRGHSRLTPPPQSKASDSFCKDRSSSPAPVPAPAVPPAIPHPAHSQRKLLWFLFKVALCYLALGGAAMGVLVWVCARV